MDPETKVMLKRTLELTEENNRMLKHARRAARWSGFLKIIWWVLILIVLPAGLYFYYLEPYMNKLLGTYQDVKGAADKVQGVALDISKLPQELKDLLSKLGLSGE